MLLLIVKMNLLAEKHTAAGNLVHRLSPKLEPGVG